MHLNKILLSLLPFTFLSCGFIEEILGSKTTDCVQAQNCLSNDSGSSYATNLIRDTENRVVVYHGINVSNVAKSPALGFTTPFGLKEFTQLRDDWGMNSVRYLVFWNAFEPKRDQYDYNYIDRIVAKMKTLDQLGVNIILDFHKDSYGEPFTEHGMPLWATDTRDENGVKIAYDPSVITSWEQIALQPAVIQAYNNFWLPKGRNDYLERYTSVIAKMTQEILNRGAFSNNFIFSIDPMNEPFPHKIYPIADYWKLDDSVLKLQKNIDAVNYFEQTILPNFYTSVKNKLSAAGIKIPLNFEPWISTSAGLPSKLSYAATSGDIYGPHFYETTTYAQKEFTPFVATQVTTMIAQKANEAKRLGSPMLFGEFGMKTGTPKGLDYIDYLLKEFDSNSASWFYYTLDNQQDSMGVYDDAGNEKEIISMLTRPYAQRIAGEFPTWYSTQNSLELNYKVTDKNAYGGPTVLYIPARVFTKTVKNLVVDINGTSYSGDQLNKLKCQNMTFSYSKKDLDSWKRLHNRKNLYCYKNDLGVTEWHRINVRYDL